MAILVTVVGAGCLLLALVLTWVLRGSTAPPPIVLSSDHSFLERAAQLAARGAGSLVGCVIAGIIVMGAGGRLMMRIIAATSPEHAQGLVTDMDAIVGVSTAGGTASFILFVGSGAGVIGWLLRMATRRLLPDRSSIAGLVGAGIGAGLLARSSSLLDPANHDFQILSPAWLAVAMILLLVILFGVALAQLSDRLAGSWRVPRTRRDIVWLAPLLPIVFLPPIAGALAAVVVLRVCVTDQDAPDWADRLLVFGPRVVLAAGLIGGAWALVDAAQILTG